MSVKLMLAKVRNDRGMTQEELAQAMNMSLGGIQYLEYNAKTVRLELLDQLCAVLKCEPGDLLQRFDDRSEEEARAAKDRLRQKKSQQMKQYWARKKRQQDEAEDAA